jgi:hypothetical protein
MQLILGVIASFVTFPTIYYTADLSQSKPNLIKWCVAFQNGYFWPALMEQVGRSFAPGSQMMVIVLNVCGYLDKTKKIVSLEMTNERDAPARVISCSASPTDNSVAMDIIGRFVGPRKGACAAADTPAIREVRRFPRFRAQNCGARHRSGQ